MTTVAMPIDKLSDREWKRFIDEMKKHYKMWTPCRASIELYRYWKSQQTFG